jgi:hypothetical protein
MAPATQRQPNAAPDGQGGVFIVFRDMRDSVNTGANIFAQHLNAQGIPLWATDGVPVVAVPGDQRLAESNRPGVVIDGYGGAFVGFTDGLNPNRVRLQHLDASGVAQWGDSGMAVTSSPPSQGGARLLEDGSGGVFVSWSATNGPDHRILAQHFGGNGNALWTPDGVIVCSSLIPQAQSMVSDGNGGLVVAWEDYRTSTADIYAQRVDASGATQWLTNGVPLCTAASDQLSLRMCSDGTGGAIVAWTDMRSGVAGVFAQRISGSGVPVWTADGVPLCTAGGTQNSPKVVSDGAGGSIVGWRDLRSGSTSDYFVQRMDAGGARLWGDDALPLCTAPESQQSLEMTSDGANGVIAIWSDGRVPGNLDLYSQRLGPSGGPLWTPNGVLIGGAPGTQDQLAIVGSAGGAIVAFADWRGSTIDLYAQRFSADGSLGSVTAVEPLNVPDGFRSPQVTPQPAVGEATISFILPAAGPASLAVFDLRGRLIRTLRVHADGPGIHRLRWDGRDESGASVSSGVYLTRLQRGDQSRSARIVLVH